MESWAGTGHSGPRGARLQFTAGPASGQYARPAPPMRLTYMLSPMVTREGLMAQETADAKFQLGHY